MAMSRRGLKRALEAEWDEVRTRRKTAPGVGPAFRGQAPRSSGPSSPFRVPRPAAGGPPRMAHGSGRARGAGWGNAARPGTGWRKSATPAPEKYAARRRALARGSTRMPDPPEHNEWAVSGIRLRPRVRPPSEPTWAGLVQRARARSRQVNRQPSPVVEERPASDAPPAPAPAKARPDLRPAVPPAVLAARTGRRRIRTLVWILAGMATGALIAWQVEWLLVSTGPGRAVLGALERAMRALRSALP